MIKRLSNNKTKKKTNLKKRKIEIKKCKTNICKYNKIIDTAELINVEFEAVK